MSQRHTFESTYPHYPFPMLVEVGIAITKLFTRTRRDDAAPKGSAVAHAQ